MLARATSIGRPPCSTLASTRSSTVHPRQRLPHPATGGIKADDATVRSDDHRAITEGQRHTVQMQVTTWAARSGLPGDQVGRAVRKSQGALLIVVTGPASIRVVPSAPPPPARVAFAWLEQHHGRRSGRGRFPNFFSMSRRPASAMAIAPSVFSVDSTDGLLIGVPALYEYHAGQRRLSDSRHNLRVTLRSQVSPSMLATVPLPRVRGRRGGNRPNQAARKKRC